MRALACLALLQPAMCGLEYVRIGALFPMVKLGNENPTPDPGGILRFAAFLMAVDEINNKTDGIADGLLPNTELRFLLRDSRRDSLATLVGALELVGSCSSQSDARDSSSIVAAIGAASSGPSESAAAAFERFKVPQISYSSTSARLSDGDAFPFFFRTPPSDSFQAEAIADVLGHRFGYSAVALVSTTDSYGEGLKNAFYELWTRRGAVVLTSQSITEDGDYELVFRELRRVRARVIVLLSQAGQAGRFLREAYEAVPRIGGEGFLVFGSDAAATPDTWLKDKSEGGLGSDTELREVVMRGFFGITASFGKGSEAYDAYRARLVEHSARWLPGLPELVLTAPHTPCEVAAAADLQGPASVWAALDDDGRPLWSQLVRNSTVCIGVRDRFAENAYAPFAYDAVYAVAHALHALIESGASEIDGDALAAALIDTVSFDGVTGRVDFYGGDVPKRRLNEGSTLYRGDRRMGVSYSVINYQGGDLVAVGRWQPCRTAEPACSFSDRYTDAEGTALEFSIDGDAPPDEVEHAYCELGEHNITDVSGCTTESGERIVELDAPFGCHRRDRLLVACEHVDARAVELTIGYVLLGVAGALKVYLLAQLYWWRADKYVKRMQPIFSAIVLIGGMMLDATTLVLPGEATPMRCLLRPTWASLSFVLFFSPLGAKSFRVWQLIGRTMGELSKDRDTEDASPQPAGDVTKARRPGASHRQGRLLGGVAALLALHGAALAIYFGTASDWQPRLLAREYRVGWAMLDADGAEFVTQRVLTLDDFACPAWTPIVYIELSLHGALGVATLLVAWKTRAVFSEFNESSVTVFAAILVGLAALIILFLKRAAMLERRAEFLFEAIVLTTTTSLVSLILFGGKLLPCFRGKGSPKSFEEWKKAAMGAFRRSYHSQPRLTRCSLMSRASCDSQMSSMPYRPASCEASTLAEEPRMIIQTSSILTHIAPPSSPPQTAREPSVAEPLVGEHEVLVRSWGHKQSTPMRSVHETVPEEHEELDESATPAAAAPASVAPVKPSVRSSAGCTAGLASHVPDPEREHDQRLTSEVPAPTRRLWVTFRTAIGAWVQPDEALEHAVAELVAQERDSSQLYPPGGLQVRRGRSRQSLGFFRASMGGGSRGSLEPQRRSVRGSVEMGAGHTLPPGSPSATLGMDLLLDGESLRLPMPRALRCVAPLDLVEQPARLKKLVQERLDEQGARLMWLEQERARRVARGKLMTATHKIRQSFWKRLRGLPTRQRAFMLTMALVAALILADAVDTLVAYSEVRHDAEIETSHSHSSSDTAYAPDDTPTLPTRNSEMISGVARLLAGLTILLVCLNAKAHALQTQGCILVALCALARTIALWSVTAYHQALGTGRTLLWLVVVVALTLLLPAAEYMRRGVHRKYGWRSFAKLARLDISLGTYHRLCILHTSLLWCLIVCAVQVVGLCVILVDRGIPASQWFAVAAPLLGLVWACTLTRRKPEELGSCLAQLSLRSTLVSLLVLFAGAVDPLFLVIHAMYRTSEVVAASGLSRAQRGNLAVVLLEEIALMVVGCVAFGTALVSIVALRREAAVLARLHRKRLAITALRGSDDDDEPGNAISPELLGKLPRLPKRIRRHIVTPDLGRALCFCRRGSMVHLLMQDGVSTSVRRHERFMHLSEDLTSLRWSWTDVLPIDEVEGVRLHDSAPLKFTISFLAHDTAHDLVNLAVEARDATQAQLWVHALGVLLRATSANDACLPTPTLRRIRAAYQAAAQSNEMLHTPALQLAFFACLNRSMDEGQLQRLRTDAARMHDDDDDDDDDDERLAEGSEGEGLPEREGSYPWMLRLYLTATRSAEVKNLFERYASEWGRGGAVLTMQGFQLFWREQQTRAHAPSKQRAPNLSSQLASVSSSMRGSQACDGNSSAAQAIDAEAARLFRRYAGDSSTLGVDAFQQLLLSTDNAAVDPRRESEICDDMTQPLSHYFIASSHNTYVTGNQLNSASSADMYRRVLLMGCRCVEIDCFDGPQGEPIVYHKNTAVTRISMRSVLEAIAETAFPSPEAPKVSNFPVILSLENHCSLAQQRVMADMFQDILGDRLQLPLEGDALEGSLYSRGGSGEEAARCKEEAAGTSSGTSPDSPAAMMGKVIIKNKRTRPISALGSVVISINEEDEDEEDSTRDEGLEEDLDTLSGVHTRERASSARSEKSSSDSSSCCSIGSTNMGSPGSSNCGAAKDLKGRANAGKAPSVHPDLDAIVAMQAVKVRQLASVDATHKCDSELPSRSERTDGKLARRSILPLERRSVSVARHASAALAHLNWPPLIVSSFKEARAQRLAHRQAAAWLSHNHKCLSRVYPAAKRQDSSNFSAVLCCELWDAGVQMVALNFQTPSKALAVNEALFSLNQRCGYVLRPQYRRERAHGAAQQRSALPQISESLTLGVASVTPHGILLRVRVIFASQLPKSGMQAACVGQPWDIYHPLCAKFAEGGMQSDHLAQGGVVSPTCSLELMGGRVGPPEEGMEGAASYYDAGSTLAVAKDGLAPAWDHEFKVACYTPESTFMLLSVNTEASTLARACVPLTALRCGYRALPLRSPNGSALEAGSVVLCHISVRPISSSAQAPQKVRRMTKTLRDAGL